MKWKPAIVAMVLTAIGSTMLDMTVSQRIGLYLCLIGWHIWMFET